MTIQAASIAMSSGYASTATHIVQESLRMGAGDTGPDDRQGDTVPASPDARILLQAGQEFELDVPALSDVKLEIARMLLERLTTAVQIQLLAPDAAAEPTAPEAVVPAGGEPWVDYRRYEFRALSETVNLSVGAALWVPSSRWTRYSRAALDHRRCDPRGRAAAGSSRRSPAGWRPDPPATPPGRSGSRP